MDNASGIRLVFGLLGMRNVQMRYTSVKKTITQNAHSSKYKLNPVCTSRLEMVRDSDNTLTALRSS